MKKDLERKLIEEFPSFFRDMYGDPRKTCMAWGCEHSDGWFDILYQLCKDIAAEGETNFHFLQIKEKFATLTLYYSGGNKKVHELVSEAERKSAEVCEQCGKPGTLDDSKYWLLTLCDECKEKRNGSDPAG